MRVFGFSAKLPLSDDYRLWVDGGFSRLETMLGRKRMLDAQVVQPDAAHFPDPFDGTPTAAQLMFNRICRYMQVEPSRIDLEIFADETEELREILPYWTHGPGGCAGMYTHDSDSNGDMAGDERLRMTVAIRSTQLKDPHALVATMAHEVGHVILLGGGLLDNRTPDHEPLTDLLTVFLGFGIFNANASARFRQFQDERRQGWSMQRLGYLPEEAYGYALAKFCLERGEDRPDWVRHLSTNVRAYYKSSLKWLQQKGSRAMTANPIV